MAKVSHADCGLRLLPGTGASGAGSIILKNPMSEQQVSLPAESMLQFGGTGWAFIQKPGSKPQWISELLPAAVCSSSEGAHYIYDP
eukprot:8688303-Lingulodinium_polyedra.AAC.1